MVLAGVHCCKYICLHKHTHTQCVCMHACMHTPTCVCTQKCMHAHLHTHTLTHTHTHTHTQTHTHTHTHTHRGVRYFLPQILLSVSAPESRWCHSPKQGCWRIVTPWQVVAHAKRWRCCKRCQVHPKTGDELWFPCHEYAHCHGK